MPEPSTARPSAALRVLPVPSPVESMISVIVQGVPAVLQLPGVEILKALPTVLAPSAVR